MTYRRPPTKIHRGVPVDTAESLVIEMLLRGPSPEKIKIGLQRACEQFEANRLFMRPEFLSASLRRHLYSPDVKVRRWSYKLVANLRDPDLLPLIRERLEHEEDPENLSWAVSAFFGLAPATERQAFVKKLDQRFRQTALELASLLYFRGEDTDFHPATDLKVFERDPLAQRWLCILCGYSMADTRVITRRYSDLDLVRNLVTHDDQEIVEYSIWAEHRHPKGSYRKILVPAHALVEQPHNVRRWFYRLITKNENAAALNAEIIIAGMKDHSGEAREGLALGLGRLKLELLRVDTAEWFASEQDERVRLALVDHIARHATSDPLYRAVLVEAYARLEPAHLLARKIESVADPRLLEDVRRTRGELPLSSELLLPAGNRELPTVHIESAIILNQAEFHMSENRSTNFTGSVVSIGTVNTGQIKDSVINNLNQTRDTTLQALSEHLKSFATAVEQEAALSPSDKASALQQIHDATVPDALEKRPGRLKTLATYVRGLLQAPGLATQFIADGRKLIEEITKVVT